MPTHCLPNSLGTAQIPVNGLTGRVTTHAPASGPYRGVIVCLHGFPLTSTPFDVPIASSSYLPDSGFVTAMTNDGWVLIVPPYPEDVFDTGPRPTVIYNDINNDSGHGTRLLSTWDLWWDHVVDYVHKTYGAAWPIATFGASWGATHGLYLAQRRMNTMIGYVMWLPVTRMQNLTISPPVDFTTGIDTSGINMVGTELNSVTIPGMVGYGSNDAYQGWGIPGQGTCPNDGSYVLPQSTTDLMIYNATNAGRPVTRYADNFGHGISAAGLTAIESYFTATIDPLAPKNL